MTPIIKPFAGKRSCLCACAFVSALILTSLLPTAVWAQVSYTGATANQNFGSEAIGSTSAAKTFSFSVAAGTTVGSIAVVTQGAINLDFNNASGSTCTAMTYSSATTCTVNVTLKPRFAGMRQGAVVFFSAAGNTGTVLGRVLVYGIGTGAQVAFAPPPPSSSPLNDPPCSNLLLSEVPASLIVTGEVDGLALSPNRLTVDSAGDVFISDGAYGGSNRVVEMPAGGGAAIIISPTVGGEGLFDPQGLAVDGAGDLFIADRANNRVVEVPAGGGAAIAIAPDPYDISLTFPVDVAVDPMGDLFIADGQDNDRVVEVPAGGGAATAIFPFVNGKALTGPDGLAFDSTGDLFIADAGNSRVLEMPAGGGAPIAFGLDFENIPGGLAVDAAGDLFIGQRGEGEFGSELQNGGSGLTCILPELSGQHYFIQDFAPDAAGNLFVVAFDPGDDYKLAVLEMQHAQPLPLNFPTVTPVGSTDSTDGTLTEQIVNIGNEALTLTALSYPADFPEAGEGANSCSGSTSLTPAQSCEVSLQFAPQVGGVLSENIVLTDNALNAAGSHQSIPVTGTAESGLKSPTPGSTFTGPSETFKWTPVTGATGYALWLGTTGVGSNNLWGSGTTTATSVTFGGLPVNGETVYARLWTTLGGVSLHADYTFTAVSQAVMTAPAAGSTFTGTSATFQWTAAPGAVSYELWLGTTGVDSNNLWSSGATTATSVTFSGLPTNGEPIYVRLWTTLSGSALHADYTYTAASQASISVSSGSGQSAYENAAFANPLVAVVKDTSGTAVQGVPVTFTAPSSGAGASFSNGAATIVATTDSTGTATVTLTANATAGNYSVMATAAGISGSVSFILTNLAVPVYPVYSVTTLVDDAVGSGTNCTDPALKVTSCSLRDAITAANALAQATATPVTAAMMPTINFAGSLNLSAQSPGNYNLTNGGTLTIGANMNIVGPGANLLTVNGAGNQIFNISSGTVFLSALSLTNGGTPTSNDPYGNGGSGTGGGISNNGTLTVTNSIFSGNSASGGGGNDGGNPEMGASGGNGYGGGIYNSGTLTVTNSTFIGNSATGGGGDGDANGGVGSGGGIYNGGQLTVTNSTFVGDSATGGGGGGGSDASGDNGYNGSGGSGGGISNGGTLTVTNSTFSGNSANGGGGGQGSNNAGNGGDGDGGGISNGGTSTVTDSTFSGNSANGGVGDSLVGGNAYGGGIENGGTLTVRNSILIGNSANGGYAFVNGVGNGAGIYNNLHTNADSNVYYNNLTNGSEDDCNGCTTNTNAVSGNPLLTALGNYGGATQTMLPQPGSAAICAGAVGDIPVGVTTDQRGFARTNSTYEGGTVCVDAGAVQSNYALAFAIEPPPIVLIGQAMSPAPAVALTESGAGATAVTSSVAMTDSDTLLSGTTTASFSSGTATFSNLLINSVTSSDRLIATLALNPTINLTAQSTVFRAQATAPAELTSPTPGSVLDGPSVTFTWTPATAGATSYDLWLGTTGVGSNNVWGSGLTTATSVTFGGLPVNGAMIYVRLWTYSNGASVYVDYTYTADTQSGLISPAPGSTLTGPSATFMWSAAIGATGYDLWLGTTGVGSNNLWGSGATTSTSVTFGRLPTNGEKIYVRLFTFFNGVDVHTDYVYTAFTAGP